MKATRSRFSIWFFPLCMFGISACFGDFDCSFDDCEVDSDCPEGSICTSPEFSLGLTCVDASRCETSADCEAFETCIIDEARAADHPFEQDVAARGVCTCDFECEQATSTSSVGGSGGSGASGGSGGASTGGAGGSGGSSTGGAGGAGGSSAGGAGGSSAGGAGGAGGAQ